MPDTPTPSSPQPRWWKLIGIQRRDGRFFRIKPTLWGYALLAGVAFAVGSAGFAEYSMQPDFCRSCHLMEPYYQAWHSSTHKDVPCVDCHFEPGFQNTIKGKWQASSQVAKFITNTYGSKPHAEVRDEACMRDGCHERRLLEGKVNWTIKNQRGVDVTIRFDHTPHLNQMRRGKQLRCVSCHSQIVQGQHIVVTLDTCFLCHFKDVKHGRDDQTIGGCRSCHDAPKQEIRLATGVFKHADYIDEPRKVGCENCHADTVTGNGAVPRQVCWNCHNQPQHLSRYGDTAFIHQNHVTNNKVECSSCHVQIVHHLEASGPAGVELLTGPASTPSPSPETGEHGAAMAQTGSCGQCHTQTHSGALEMYRGTGGRGVPDMPSPMFRAQVDCIACHRFGEHGEGKASVVGQTFVAAQQACDKCHDSRYADVLANWKAMIGQQVDETEQAVADAREALAGVSADSNKLDLLKLRRLLDDAEHNLRLVKLSRGLHNVNYATALLSVAVENSQTIKDSLAQPTTPTPGSDWKAGDGIAGPEVQQ